MKVKFVKLILALYFISPVLIIAYYFKYQADESLKEIVVAVQNSLYHGFVTSVLALSVGFLVAPSVLVFRKKIRLILQYLLLVPIYLPSLFVILIALSLFNPFPMGNNGVVIVLIMIHLGYVISLLSVQIEHQIGSLAHVSLIYNLSKWNFLKNILFPQIKSTLAFLFVIIFVNSITAFTIPFILGGGRGRNLEILIYEKIFVDYKWFSAILICVIQQISISTMTYFFIKKEVFKKNYSEVTYPFQYVFKLSYFMLFGYLGVFGFGYIKLALNAFSHKYIGLLYEKYFYSDIYYSFLNSIVLFFSNIIIFSFLFLLVLYLLWCNAKTRFLSLFMNSSVVLVGVAYYFLFPIQNLFLNILKISIIFNIVYFVTLYKSVLEKPILQLKSQILVSQIYNLNFVYCLKVILLPQLKKVLFYLGSVLFLMTISEFAIIKVSGANLSTLGILMASYLSSYRLEGAFIISVVILLIWLIFSGLIGVLIGAYKKS